MTYQRFEDLPVWQQSITLAERIYELTNEEAFAGQRSLRDQLERASVSISNNIAEGFERGSRNELLNYLYIARGSAAEVRSMLCLLQRLPRFKALTSRCEEVKSVAESCSRQLRAWAGNLQQSKIQGSKYITKTSRNLRTKEGG